MIVTFFSWLMLHSRFMRSSEFSSSMLDVGSSANIIFGLFANARMTAMRCRSPPLRVSGNLSARFVRSKYFRSWRVLSFLSFLFIPASAWGSSMFSLIVREGIRLKNWNTKPMWCSLRFDFLLSLSFSVFNPKSLSVPSSGCSRRPISLRRVVLPVPDLALIATNSPSLTLRFMPLRTSVVL